MLTQWRRTGALLLPTVALTLTASCATTGSEPHPVEISALETRLQQDQSDMATLARLGVAYQAAGRHEDARAVLERAVEQGPDFVPAAFFLGLTYEELGRFGDAARLYQSVSDQSAEDDLARALAARLPHVQRMALQEGLKASLAAESGLRARPAPNTVAVFPFVFLGSDPELAPLGRALAEMVVGDLAQTDRLTVLERLRVQMLLDELQLAERGIVDSSTAARSGRLLGAGRIVQGQVLGDAEEITLDVAIAEVGLRATGGRNPIQARDRLDRLFDLEETVVFALFAEMGIQLTTAERERVAQRPTQNVQALLAYGLGLEAEDRGNYDAAVSAYTNATTLDPSFREADVARGRAEGLRSAERTSVEALIEQGSSLLPEIGLRDWMTRRYAFLPLEGIIPFGTIRDATVEVSGIEGLPPGITGSGLTITLRRP